MRDRAFGVEIECYFPGGPVRARDTLLAAGFRPWADQYIHQDGSGCEIPSPILRGQKGLNELQAVMALLRENGAYTSYEDGLHVHHDAPEFVEDDDLVTRLVTTWGANQEHISQFVAEYRRRNHWACETSAWREEHLENVLRNKESYRNDPHLSQTKAWGQKFHALNISALSEHGTIEFRQHEGTLEFAYARAWIMFGQSFLETVKGRKKFFTCSDSADLLKKVKACKSASDVLMTKVANPVVPSSLGDREYYEEDDYCGCCEDCCGSCGCCCGCY